MEDKSLESEIKKTKRLKKLFKLTSSQLCLLRPECICSFGMFGNEYNGRKKKIIFENYGVVSEKKGKKTLVYLSESVLCDDNKERNLNEIRSLKLEGSYVEIEDNCFKKMNQGDKFRMIHYESLDSKNEVSYNIAPLKGFNKEVKLVNPKYAKTREDILKKHI